MSKQHSVAHQLLPIIRTAVETGEALTYSSVAEKLGRPRDNARMVAQVCDLLDAAAAFAGIPLLALVMVRELSGGVNREAWKGQNEPAWVSGAIIRRSEQHKEQHKFGPAEFAAIDKSLKNLTGLSNRAAWRLFFNGVSRDKRYRELAGLDSATEDAINDIGSDAPVRTPTLSIAYARDPRVRAAVLRRAQGKCEYCGEIGFLCNDGSHYLESHQIIALADDGADRMKNVIALCPNEHREAHFGNRRNEIEQEMIRIVENLVGHPTAATPTGA